MTALVTSELRKVLSLRFWWALALGPVVVALFAGAIYSTVDDLGSFDGELHTNAASVVLLIAMAWTILFAGVFGAVNAGTEYRHQTLTPTFATTRGRDTVIGAKLAVTALFGIGYAILVEVVALICMLVFGAGHLVLDASVVGMLASGILVTAAWSLIGAGLGLLFASPAAAAITLVAWYPVGELLTDAALGGLGGESLIRWLPGALTWSTMADPTNDIDSLVPWPAAILGLLVWTAAAAGLGWWTTRRRDIT